MNPFEHFPTLGWGCRALKFIIFFFSTVYLMWSEICCAAARRSLLYDRVPHVPTAAAAAQKGYASERFQHHVLSQRQSNVHNRQLIYTYMHVIYAAAQVCVCVFVRCCRTTETSKSSRQQRMAHALRTAENTQIPATTRRVTPASTFPGRVPQLQSRRQLCVERK